MREILFRGQTRKKGEKVRLDGSPIDGNWVHGGVNQGKGNHSIIYQTEPEFGKYPVHTDTLGQYTGLTDKNGRKIFEGDIIRQTETGETFIVQWFPEHLAFMVWNKSENTVGYMDECWKLIAEVIGNIHDNPELVSG